MHVLITLNVLSRFSIFLQWRSCVCVCVWINISLHIKLSPRHVGVGWIMKTLQGIVRLVWLDGLVFKGDNWYICSASIAVAPVQCVITTVNCQLALCMTQNCAEAFASLELSISMFSWNSRKPVSTVIKKFCWTSFIWLRWQIIMPLSLHSSDVYNPHFFLFFLKSPVLIISIPMAWAVYKHAFHRAVKVFTTNLTWVCLVIPVQYASALLEVVQPWSTDSVQAF